MTHVDISFVIYDCHDPFWRPFGVLLSDYFGFERGFLISPENFFQKESSMRKHQSIASWHCVLRCDQLVQSVGWQADHVLAGRKRASFSTDPSTCKVHVHTKVLVRGWFLLLHWILCPTDISVLPKDLLLGQGDRKSTRLNSSHSGESRMPSSA